MRGLAALPKAFREPWRSLRLCSRASVSSFFPQKTLLRAFFSASAAAIINIHPFNTDTENLAKKRV